MKHACTAALAGLVLAGLGFAAPAGAQQQQVTPPRVVYWMDVKTVSGFQGMAEAGSGFSSAISIARGGPQTNATMLLQLGSQEGPTSGAPQAAHTVPAGARVGPELPLVTPRRPPAGPRTEGATEYEQPRGRMLLYFGCGERARAGQPIVFDFARMAAGQMPAGLESRIRAARVQTFSPSAWRTYGEWPNDRQRGAAVIPAGGSLSGQHVVRGNYNPEITFTLGGVHDVMAPISFTSNRRNPSGSVALAWQSVPNATGYHAFAIGQGASENEMVFWTSSEVATFDAGGMGHLPPAEVARLIRERVVMAPSTSSCTVPLEASQAMRGGGRGGEPAGGVLFFNAFGPEANFVHPARPTDPRTPWVQQWAVKARFHSATMDLLGQSMAEMMAGAGGRGAGPNAGMSQEEYCRQVAAQRSQTVQGEAGSAVGGATGIPGAGMIGRAIGNRMARNRQAQQPPADPNCPAPAPAGR